MANVSITPESHACVNHLRIVQRWKVREQPRIGCGSIGAIDLESTPQPRSGDNALVTYKADHLQHFNTESGVLRRQLLAKFQKTEI
jgi:hypothetical protein